MNEKYDLINSFLENKNFQIEGNYLHPTISEIDGKVVFQFKITDEIELISVGTPRPYLSFDVKILDLEPKFISEIYKGKKYHGHNEIKSEFYYLSILLEEEISKFMKLFSVATKPLINEIQFPEVKKNLQEGKGAKRNVVRQIVKDLISVFKRGEGTYTLPEDISGDMTYEFHNMNSDFTVEVKIDETEIVEGFEIDGGYYDDDDTLEIQIIYNPKFFPEIYYDLIGELNEVVRHELQHLIQAEKGIERPTDETDPEKYYTQPHEIDALISGFRRLSKIRKQPFEKIVRDSFYKNDNMDDESKERVIQKILSHK